MKNVHNLSKMTRIGGKMPIICPNCREYPQNVDNAENVDNVENLRKNVDNQKVCLQSEEAPHRILRDTRVRGGVSELPPWIHFFMLKTTTESNWIHFFLCWSFDLNPTESNWIHFFLCWSSDLNPTESNWIHFFLCWSFDLNPTESNWIHFFLCWSWIHLNPPESNFC